MEFATDEHLNLSSQPVPRTESDSPSLSVGTIVNTSKVADPSASATTSSSLVPQQSEGFRMYTDFYLHIKVYSSNFSIRMKPRLPPELQMITIDWMVVATNENGFRKLKDQTTLLNCMCVCYAWKSYIQKFLHNDVYIKIEESCNNLLKWREFLKHNPSKVKSIRSIALSCDGLDLTYAALLITQKLQSLETLYILQWNLGEEPFWIYRAAACMTSLNCLHLDSLKQCTVAQLVKIINSFHHLSKLSVNFAHPNQKLEVKNQPLSRPCRLPTFSLESLRIEHIEGVSILLDWFVEANPFVANLKELALRLWARDIDEEDENEEESNCEGFSRFLDHCGGSLEQLTLWIDLSEKDDTINFSKFASI